MELAILIPIIALIAGTLIIKWGLEYSRWRQEFGRGDAAAGNSLGLSELKTMIREAIEEANEPLLDRVEALESRLDTPPLLGTALLDEPLDDAYVAEAAPHAPQHQPVR